MTNWKDQQRIQTAQWQWCCFYGALKMILLVTMFDMVSAASNETNTSDYFAMDDIYSASTSADINSEESIASYNLDDNISLSTFVNTTVLDVTSNIDVAVNNSDADASSSVPNMFDPTFSNSPSTFVSSIDVTNLVSVTDTNVPISFTISVAHVHDASDNSSSSITNSETNITPNTTVETVTNSNITETIDAIADTNTSVTYYFDITNPDTDADASTDTDYSRTISFVTGESALNPIDTNITIFHLSSATTRQFNITNLNSENVNSMVSIANVSSTVALSTEVTTTNTPTTTVITNRTSITSSTEAEPNIGCALTKCQELYSSNATPLMNVSWWTNNDAEDWATFNGTAAAGGRWLANAVHLYELATVEEGMEWTTVCVGALLITSFSHRNSTTVPDVEIKIQTSRDVPVGLVRLRTHCWLATGFFAECSPSFTPLPYIMDLPFYDQSPFDEEFWVQMTRTVMEVKSSWIRAINITTFQGSISPQWIFNMNISSLKDLHITGNHWNFTDRILSNMPELIHLTLTNNSIESLPEDIFDGMPSLETLIVNTNSLFKYPSSISHLFKLLNLDLSNYVDNRNLRIDKEYIKLLPRNLRNIKATNAKLHVNLDMLLLPELRFLNISSNRVKLCLVPSNTSKVEILDVSENKLVKISDNFFSSMPFLKILILNQNHLYGLPNFPKQNNLTHLYASDNLLTSLSRTTFVYLKKLQVLDVSRCRINFLGTAFVNAVSLRSILFSHNLLRDINDFSFSFLPELHEVDFSHNYIKSVYLWKWKLRKLDLSSNRLNDFRTNLSAIEYVDVSHNLIQNIDIVLSSVQILNVSHNSLTYLSPKLWNNISQTLLVDLGGNYFLCCSFQNSEYLSDHFYTKIQNLGSVEPIKCYINTEVSKILFQSEVYDGDLCRSTKESITTFVVVLPIVFTIILAAVLAVLTMYVIQFGRRKFIVKHSLDTVVRNTSM